MDMYGGMMWVGWLMMLIPIAGLALLALLVAVLVRGRVGGRDDSALEILQRRYARGEIGHDDFERMRATLLTRPQ